MTLVMGDLSEKGISEPLRTIHQNSQSGTLLVRRQGITKELVFDQGVCGDARSNDPAEGLGEFLLRIGKLSPDQLDAATQAGNTTSVLPATLLEMKLVAPSELADFRALHAQEIVYSLFNWNSGSFEFKPEKSSPNGTGSLHLTVPNLIFEGIRRLTNPDIIHRGLKGPDRLIRLAPQFEAKAAEIFLKPDEAFILSRIESSARISEVLQLSPLGLDMTQKMLYGFLATGIVEFVQQTTPPTAPQPPAASRVYRSTSAPTYQPAPGNDDPEIKEEDLATVRSDVFLMLDKAKTRNYYELLGVPATASPDEIKKSYYTLAKKYHPDRYHQTTQEDLKNALDAIFSTLSQAYDTLKVPATRGSYDAKTFRLESPAGTPEKPAASPAPGPAPQQKLAELNYRQGRSNYEQEDYWSAIQALRQSVRIEPENPRYRYWLAMALSKNAKWRREAEEHFLKAISLDQFVPDYYVGLGFLYQEAGMHKRAETQLRQALQISPGDSNARVALDALLGAADKKSKRSGAFKGFFTRK
jgi:curved DNA-binding protein CbpA